MNLHILRRVVDAALPDAASRAKAVAVILASKAGAPAAAWIFGQAASAASGSSAPPALAFLGLLGLAGAFALVKLSDACAAFARNAFVVPRCISGARKLQAEAFEALARARPETLSAPPGELAARADCGPDARAAVSFLLSAILPAVAELALACVFVASAASLLAALGLLACSALIVGVSVFVAPKAASAAKAHAAATLAVKARTADLLPAFLEAKAFGAEASACAAFEDSAAAEAAALVASKRVDYAMDALFLVASGAGASVSFWLSALAVSSGSASPAEFVASVSLSAMAVASVSQIGWAFRELSNSTARLTWAFELIDAPRERSGGLDPACGPDDAPALEFDRTCVRLGSASVPILDGVRLQLSRGEKIAVVGPSGAGKTTLVSCSLLFSPIASGRILLHGVDSASADPALWRRSLGWVPQHPKPVMATVRSYLSMGRPLPDADLACALASLGLDLPLDEPVGFGGRQASGGEWQRLAMARALLSPCSVLLLDEPSSALDASSQEALAQALLSDPRSALAVTHNLALAARFDRVAYMEGGAVLDVGAPDEMALRCPGYRRLLDGGASASA